MVIKDFFKKELEKIFLYSKVLVEIEYERILKEYIGEIANIIKYDNDMIIIQLQFDDATFTYEMEIVQGQKFKKICSINVK